MVDVSSNVTNYYVLAKSVKQEMAMNATKVIPVSEIASRPRWMMTSIAVVKLLSSSSLLLRSLSRTLRGDFGHCATSA